MNFFIHDRPFLNDRSTVSASASPICRRSNALPPQSSATSYSTTPTGSLHGPCCLTSPPRWSSVNRSIHIISDRRVMSDSLYYVEIIAVPRCKAKQRPKGAMGYGPTSGGSNTLRPIDFPWASLSPLYCTGVMLLKIRNVRTLSFPPDICSENM